MELIQYKVTNFRSVEDSGWIETPRITAFIGTNESGKTNVVIPLWKLNPSSGGDINLLEDMPREKFSQMRNQKPSPVFIDAVFSLDEKEQKTSHEILESSEYDLSTVEVKRSFDGEYHWDFPSLEVRKKEVIAKTKKIFDKWSSQSFTEERKTEKERIEVIQQGINKIKEILEKDTDPIDAVRREVTNIGLDDKQTKVNESWRKDSTQIIALINSVDPASIKANKKFMDYLKQELPKFVYYSNYGNLDSEIYFPQVIQNLSRNDLAGKVAAQTRTIRTLFSYLQLDPQEVYDLGKTQSSTLSESEIKDFSEKRKERTVLLDSASAEFTQKFKQWWKQGEYTFEFKVDGDFFKIWVSDKDRPAKISLEERSTGLQWFFSFYLTFLVEAQKGHKNAILLLDEPGVTLHPLAQKDLFKFFEGLAEENQLLYTTHSPFMVDSNNLDRVRCVYVDRAGTTKVSADLRASEKNKGKNQVKSIYPVNAALGLTVSDTLLINCLPVLVEGTSDQVYLSAFKNYLISKRIIHPLREIVFIPTGGTRGIRTTASILAGKNNENPYVILDGDKAGHKIFNELKDELYANNPERLIKLSDFSKATEPEIEDLIPREAFAHIAETSIQRPEDTEESFSDYLEDADDSRPIWNIFEEYCENNDIEIKPGALKVKIANSIKRKLLKKGSKIFESDSPELKIIVDIFKRFLPEEDF